MTRTLTPTVDQVLQQQWWRVEKAVNGVMGYLRRRGVEEDRDAVESEIGYSLWQAARKWCTLVRRGQEPTDAQAWWKRSMVWSRNSAVATLKGHKPPTIHLSTLTINSDCAPTYVLTDDYPMCNYNDLLGPGQESVVEAIISGEKRRETVGRRQWERERRQIADKLGVVL